MTASAHDRARARHTLTKALTDIDLDENESAVERLDKAKALLEGDE